MARQRSSLIFAAAATRAMSNRVRWLVALGALGCIAARSVSPAQGYVPSPPYLACFNSSQNDMAVLESSLSPAINAFVQAGTPVTFSGNSGAPVTFAVASSAALLSSPDLDSGLGTLQPGTSTYTFTSTKATATPGILVYWDASFSNAAFTACEGMTPATYTTKVRTFTVVSPTPTEAEAAAAKKKQEEAAAAVTPTGSVSLAGSTITVQSTQDAAVKLRCTGTGTCGGKLTLTGHGTIKKGKKLKTETIGTATFSIPSGKTATIELELNAAGRALLGVDHGRLSVILMIVKSSPAPAQTHIENVYLTQQKAHGKAKK